MTDALAPDRQRRLNALRIDKRRQAEQADAFHFLLAGHDAHAERCIFDDKCSRNYDAGEAPADERLYMGTGIGLLYGLGGEQHAWQLAGWNVRSSS